MASFMTTMITKKIIVEQAKPKIEPIKLSKTLCDVTTDSATPPVFLLIQPSALKPFRFVYSAR